MLSSWVSSCVGVLMDPEQSSQLLAPFSHQQQSAHPITAAGQPSSKASSSVHKLVIAPPQLSHTFETIQPQEAREKERIPRLSMPPGLSESNKKFLLALGLEEVYKRMAQNHKFHIDVVQKVAASQKSLENADQVLCSMRKAAEHEYVRLMKQEFDKEEGEGEGEGEGEEEEDASN
jgi:hypothetical protein